VLLRFDSKGPAVIQACVFKGRAEHCIHYMESEIAHLPLWQNAWAWFEANKKQALGGAGSLLVLGVIIAFFLYRQNEGEITASEALSSIAVTQSSGAAGRSDDADAYLKVAAAYPKSSAGARAQLLAAGSLFAEGKYDASKGEFERFKREHGDSPFVGEALLGIAACLDAQGKSREAITAYKDLIDHRPTDYVLPQARFALGRLYEAQNEPDQARIQFEEVERSNPYGSLGSEAGMRLEELKIKYPNLGAVKTPMPTNAIPLKVEKPK
jgi:tetratricopeptide (TPR) repeat protein